MKVLVTGHAGYIGSVLVRTLRSAGHEVEGLDAGWFDGCDFGGEPEPIPERRLDIRDAEADALRGCDAVVHLAALSNDPLGDVDPALTHQINGAATVRLARLAREAGVRIFAHSSTCSLYGAAGSSEVDESAAFNPVTPYGESKVWAEARLSRLASADFSPVFLRNATAYGISPRLRADLVVNNLVGYAMTTGEVLLKSDGTPWRPLVHVEDIAHAFLCALQAPRERVHGRAFNIGRRGENYRVRDVASLVESLVPGSRVSYAAGASADRRDYRVSFELAAAELPGFRPAWTLTRGIEQIRDAYAKNGLERDDFLGPRYQRIQQVLRLREQGRLDASLRWTGAGAPDERLSASPRGGPPRGARRQPR